MHISCAAVICIQISFKVSIKEVIIMWQNIDNFDNGNYSDNLDITAFMSLLHVTGYCGDLDEEREVDPFLWTGGFSVEKQIPSMVW